ncbi:MAG: hypothetical protein IPM02_08460 [Betaproteobacteria bacterium]|nr:hypothetical protein [Betaproteobacteria bacterium]
MKMHRGLTALGIALVLSGCALLSPDKEPLVITPRSEVATSPVVREILPQPAPPATPPPESAPSVPASPDTAAAAAQPRARRAAHRRRTATPAHAAPARTAPAAPTLPGAAPPVAIPANVPPGTLYVCTATVNGQTQQTAIEYEPRVKQLCSKHPEMGVCQYERDACRASGGRVHTATGVEITRQTEAEYDKKVMRVRFRAG